MILIPDFHAPLAGVGRHRYRVVNGTNSGSLGAVGKHRLSGCPKEVMYKG